MFEQQPGCLGALFLRSGNECIVLTLWRDKESVERLKTSKSYLDVITYYGASGVWVEEPSLQVFEVSSGFLAEGLAASVPESRSSGAGWASE